MHTENSMEEKFLHDLEISISNVKEKYTNTNEDSSFSASIYCTNQTVKNEMLIEKSLHLLLDTIYETKI